MSLGRSPLGLNPLGLPRKSVSGGGGTTYPTTLTTTAGVSSTTLVKSVGKFLTTTASVSSTTISRIVARLKTLATTASVSVVSIAKAVSKTITTTASVSSTTISRAVSFLKTLITTASVSVTSILKQIGKVIITTPSVSVLSIVKQVGKSLVAASISVVSVILTHLNAIIPNPLNAFPLNVIVLNGNGIVGTAGTMYYQTLAAIQTSLATILYSFGYGRILTATSISSVSLVRGFFKTLIATSVNLANVSYVHMIAIKDALAKFTIRVEKKLLNIQRVITSLLVVNRFPQRVITVTRNNLIYKQRKGNG